MLEFAAGEDLGLRQVDDECALLVLLDLSAGEDLVELFQAHRRIDLARRVREAVQALVLLGGAFRLDEVQPAVLAGAGAADAAAVAFATSVLRVAAAVRAVAAVLESSGNVASCHNRITSSSGPSR